MIVSAGLNDTVKLWDLAMMEKPVLEFESNMLQKCAESNDCYLKFNHNNDYSNFAQNNIDLFPLNYQIYLFPILIFQSLENLYERLNNCNLYFQLRVEIQKKKLNLAAQKNRKR